MKIDLTKGISLQIAEELGKYNILPIETLVKIAENLQNLLMTLATTDLESSDPIHLENFTIEQSII